MKSIFSPSLLNEKSNVGSVVPKVGDILLSTWGYDQTNADFYKVVKASPSMVSLVQLKASEKSEDGNWMFGRSTPTNLEYGPVFSRRIKSGGNNYSVKIASYSSAYPWDGNPVSVSHTN